MVRFPVALADGQQFANINRQLVALSPDGKRIAFLVADSAGKIGLMERSLADIEARPVGGPSLPVRRASGPNTDRWDKANIVVRPIGSDARQVVVRGGSAHPSSM